MVKSLRRSVLLLSLLLESATSSPAFPRTTKNSTCTKTKVAVLGAGMAGVAAAQSLHNASISDFILVDVNSYIGGRVAHTTFGTNPTTGLPYTVELGANWVQGLVSSGGPENPIWTLAKKWGVQNTYSNYSSIQTYDENGIADFAGMLDEYEDAYAGVEQDAGAILTENLQDRTMRVGLSIEDWKPKKDMKAQAAEWWEFDWEYAYSPDQSSQTWAIVNYNTTFYQFSEENNYVFDQRGFNYFIVSEASTFLPANDTRLHLSTNVTSISYSNTGVTITNADDSCIEAEYAICTFSLGVLQNDIVEFDPVLPAWKQAGIEGMQMGTYTKIFLQFPPAEDGSFFWEGGPDPGTQFFLYADPVERGWYPVFQSLSAPGFIPESGIFFVTVVYAQSYRAEQQSDDATKAEVMSVLKKMFGTDIPDPIDFMYPRWSTEPWAYGSYSNWPPGLSIETHQNLRANLGRLWFAGEATSAEYFGFLQGAYTEGQAVGKTIAGCINGNETDCKSEPNYETVRGCTTSERQLSVDNGWIVSSMETYGDV